MKQFETFEEFWPFYVTEHSKKATRMFHFVGTTAAMACLAGAVLTRKKWLLAVAPLVGYGPAWVSHFFIEKNKPASFKNPLWSFRADMVMWAKIATGKMDAEVERCLAEQRAHSVKESAESPSAHTDGTSVVTSATVSDTVN